MRLYDIRDSNLKIKETMSIKNPFIYEIAKVSVMNKSTVCNVINKDNNDLRISTLLKLIYAMEEDPANFFVSLKS